MGRVGLVLGSSLEPTRDIGLGNDLSVVMHRLGGPVPRSRRCSYRFAGAETQVEGR
jgi:hypothetical protein